MSHMSASSHPPPSAYPFTAAMMGLRTLEGGRVTGEEEGGTEVDGEPSGQRSSTAGGGHGGA